ncbi:MAG TPA: SIMPL domain-containing protein [Anaerolineales bacterium]|nr:SIMPL domain-containing protein [Anaerolineales bacterium]
MKTKSVLFTTLALLAILVSACAPAAGGSATTPNLSVTGTGTAYLVPDIAYIYLGVHTELPTASDAVAANNTQTETMIQALTDFGIDAKDIRTTNFSIYPFDKYDPLTGVTTGEKYYSVDNTVYVTIRDLTQLGGLLDTVVSAGANTVNSIQFDVADRDTALKQARADAITDAKEKAEELAAVAGVTIGDIQSITFTDSQPYPLYDGRGGGGGGAEAAVVPIQPGQLTFMVSVNVTYTIK